MSDYEEGQGCVTLMAIALFILGSLSLFGGAIPAALGLYILGTILIVAVDE